MDAAERTLLAETVRSVLEQPGDQSGQPLAPKRVDDALAELGWREMLAAEPDAALEIVFTALGATNRAATALDDVLVAALGCEPRPDRAALLPAFGSWDPPFAQGLATARVTTATELVVAGAVVPIASVTVTKLHGIDPDAGWCTVTVDAPATTSDQWDTAVALGRRAVAYEIAGASRAMLELAREHALERVQFGRPVARFQAVRHRLAEALVAIESLDACLDAAAHAPGPETAALAKAAAGRTARSVAGHCQQVLAGIGFTTDHPFHRSLKRTMLLDGVFGTADDIVTALGHMLLAIRRVPTLIEL